MYPDAIPVPRQGDGGLCRQDRIGQTWLCQISLTLSGDGRELSKECSMLARFQTRWVQALMQPPQRCDDKIPDLAGAKSRSRCQSQCAMPTPQSHRRRLADRGRPEPSPGRAWAQYRRVCGGGARGSTGRRGVLWVLCYPERKALQHGQ